MRDYGDEDDAAERAAANEGLGLAIGHPNLSKQVNDNLMNSYIAGGAQIDKLAVGKTLRVKTQNTTYLIKRDEHGYTIEGHQVYCPTPTSCSINGSTWGGSMLKMGYVGIGMLLEFNIRIGGERVTLTTSPISSVEEVG